MFLLCMFQPRLTGLLQFLEHLSYRITIIARLFYLFLATKIDGALVGVEFMNCSAVRLRRRLGLLGEE